MARSLQLLALAVPLMLLGLMCRPVSAQLGANIAAAIPGVNALDSIGTGDTIANVLSTLGVNSNIIDSIVQPIANSRDAASTVRDLITSTAGSRRDALQQGIMGQISTPTQAVSRFQELMNGAFRDAAAQLADSMFSRGGATGLFRAANTNGSGPSFRQSLAVPVGFGLPVDPSAFLGPFTAGTGLPPLQSATPADFSTFSQQLFGDITRQTNAVAEFQRQAAQRQRADRAMNGACTQYALSEFLRTFATTLLTLGQPAGAIFSVLGQFSGLGYGGLSQQGNAYLNAYCCNLVRSAGIAVDPSILTSALGGLANQGLNLDLTRLLGVIPGVPAGATNAISSVLSAATGGLVRSSGGHGSTAPGAVVGGPGTLGTNGGATTCNVLDWLAFALQNDPQLANRFSNLLTNVLRYQSRLFSDSLTSSNRAGNTASRLVNRVAGGRGAGAAAAGNPALGGLLDAVGAGAGPGAGAGR